MFYPNVQLSTNKLDVSRHFVTRYKKQTNKQNKKGDSLRKNKADSPLIHLLSSHNELVITVLSFETSFTSFQEVFLCFEISLNSSGSHHKSKQRDKVFGDETVVGVE